MEGGGGDISRCMYRKVLYIRQMQLYLISSLCTTCTHTQHTLTTGRIVMKSRSGRRISHRKHYARLFASLYHGCVLTAFVKQRDASKTVNSEAGCITCHRHSPIVSIETNSIIQSIRNARRKYWIKQHTRVYVFSHRKWWRLIQSYIGAFIDFCWNLGTFDELNLPTLWRLGVAFRR